MGMSKDLWESYEQAEWDALSEEEQADRISHFRYLQDLEEEENGN